MRELPFKSERVWRPAMSGYDIQTLGMVQVPPRQEGKMSTWLFESLLQDRVLWMLETMPDPDLLPMLLAEYLPDLFRHNDLKLLAEEIVGMAMPRLDDMGILADAPPIPTEPDHDAIERIMDCSLEEWLGALPTW